MMSFDKRQLRLVLVLLVAVTIVLSAIYLFVFRVRYVPAYENIRESEASAIVAEFEKAEIPYRLENDGHDILVPEDRAAEARVLIAGADVALGGTVGFELFNDSDMGLTEFAQKINLQRALQGELARTIMGMEGVEFARVHLALPERSIFRAEQGEPTAAVTLQMKPGRPLSQQRIDGIRQLVAFSVPDLQPQAVAILDDKGDLVSTVASPDNGFDAPLTERAALEQYYETRARDAIAAATPGLRFQVTVSTRQPALPAVPGSTGERVPARDQFLLNVMVRTRDELLPEQQDRIEALLADELGLDRRRGDSLVFSIGLVSSPAPVPVPIPSLPAAPDVATTDQLAPVASWDWLFSRWTLIALVLAGIAGLILRPRRQLDDEAAANFAELLKGGMAEREAANAR